MTTQDEAIKATIKEIEKLPKGYFKDRLLRILPYLVGIIILALIISIGFIIYASNYNQIDKYFEEATPKMIISQMVIWILLFLISTLGTIRVRTILREQKNEYQKKANYISVIIGLVAVVILFMQPYLDLLFGDYDAGKLLMFVFFGVGSVSGWVVWFLKEVKKYGEFFHIFLFIVAIGLSWYARVSAPEEVQTIAIGFILGSLFRIAKDYMDLAMKSE